MASSPTIVLRNIAPHKTQNLHNVVTKKSNETTNQIIDTKQTRYNFNFIVTLTNSDYNGFSGFLDQISFSLSEYNYHAWPLYLFQWLDDDDFHSGPMPALHSHTKHGFFHWTFVFSQRFENDMGHFGDFYQDKSDTIYDMSINYGLWGTFGQNVDNQWNADRAASKPLIGITFHFGFTWAKDFGYKTVAPSFNIMMTQ